MKQRVDRYSILDCDAGLTDLVGRIRLTYVFAPQYAVAVLEVADRNAVAMIETGRLPCPFDVTCPEPLFVNVLVRLETGFRHDSATIRRVMEQPLVMFAAQSIANMVGGTLDDLRAVRSMPSPHPARIVLHKSLTACPRTARQRQARSTRR